MRAAPHFQPRPHYAVRCRNKGFTVRDAKNRRARVNIREHQDYLQNLGNHHHLLLGSHITVFLAGVAVVLHVYL